MLSTVTIHELYGRTDLAYSDVDDLYLLFHCIADEYLTNRPFERTVPASSGRRSYDPVDKYPNIEDIRQTETMDMYGV